jgi:hypothetical protein
MWETIRFAATLDWQRRWLQLKYPSAGAVPQDAPVRAIGARPSPYEPGGPLRPAWSETGTAETPSARHHKQFLSVQPVVGSKALAYVQIGGTRVPDGGS